MIIHSRKANRKLVVEKPQELKKQPTRKKKVYREIKKQQEVVVKEEKLGE